MIEIIRTNSENPYFIELVRQLDKSLAILDGDEHAFYAQFNTLEKIKYALVAYTNEMPVGCGAIREKHKGAVEIKRMYVVPEKRGLGIATTIVKALEIWANELSFDTCVLETGKRQIEAVNLYKKLGYSIIPNFHPYENMDNSICFEKKIKEKK